MPQVAAIGVSVAIENRVLAKSSGAALARDRHKQ